MTGLHGKPGPGRPRRRRVVGTVLALRADEYLDRQLRGTARNAVRWLVSRTGARLPGYGRVNTRRFARAMGVGPRQLYRIRARIAPWVQTRVVGGELVVWSLMGARARASQGRFDQWWEAYKSLAMLAPHAPFLREVHAFLAETEQKTLFPEEYRVSADGARRGARDSGIWPVARPETAVTPRPIPEEYRVSEASLSSRRRAAGDGGGFWDANTGISRGFCGVDRLTKMSGQVTPFPEQYRVSTTRCRGTKQGREIQDWNEVSSAASASSKTFTPPLSGSARGGVGGSGGERESPAPALSDTVTADHGAAEGTVAPPLSETRLKVTKEGSTMTREESLAALAALEAGELELPETPGAPLRRPDAPTAPPPPPDVTPLAEALAEARKPPPKGLAKGKGERATLRGFAVAFVAAMQRVLPSWRYPTGDDANAGLAAVFDEHCRGKSATAMQRWVELNATRFARDERRDGWHPKNWPGFLAVKRAEAPPVLEPELRGWDPGGGYVDAGPLAALDAIEGPVLRRAAL